MTPTEQLQAVKDLIGTPDKWTQKAYARDLIDERVSVDDAEAVKFSLVGAVRKLQTGPEALSALQDAVSAALAPGYSIVAFNESEARTHAQVMSLLDAAIMRAS